MAGAWRLGNQVSLVEIYVPFTAYHMLALTADPRQEWFTLKNSLLTNLQVNLRLPEHKCVCMSVNFTVCSVSRFVLHVFERLRMGLSSKFVCARLRGRASMEHPKRWKKITVYGASREQVAFVKGKWV